MVPMQVVGASLAVVSAVGAVAALRAWRRSGVRSTGAIVVSLVCAGAYGVNMYKGSVAATAVAAAGLLASILCVQWFVRSENVARHGAGTTVAPTYRRTAAYLLMSGVRMASAVGASYYALTTFMGTQPAVMLARAAGLAGLALLIDRKMRRSRAGEALLDPGGLELRRIAENSLKQDLAEAVIARDSLRSESRDHGRSR